LVSFKKIIARKESEKVALIADGCRYAQIVIDLLNALLNRGMPKYENQNVY